MTQENEKDALDKGETQTITADDVAGVSAAEILGEEPHTGAPAHEHAEDGSSVEVEESPEVAAAEDVSDAPAPEQDAEQPAVTPVIGMTVSYTDGKAILAAIITDLHEGGLVDLTTFPSGLDPVNEKNVPYDSSRLVRSWMQK